MTIRPEDTARLLITCPDAPGIVSAVTSFLFHHGANVTELDQHSTDARGGQFFLRLEFQTPDLDLTAEAIKRAFEEVVARPFSMNWRMSFGSNRPRMVLLVSRHEHALMEILWRWSNDELRADIPLVISNHADLASKVESFGIDFAHVPFSAETQQAAEAQILDLTRERADVIVLARFMRILSGEFVSHFDNRIINIHHSFLPAFAGADPYRQAYSKGVKIIGATAHYVTADLDQGPIIEQNVSRVSHRMSVDELKRLGRDLERQVLARAVRWHLEDRVLLDGNKTVVFS